MKFLFLFLFAILFSGCATVFKGYYDEVEIINSPAGLTITNQHGVQIPVLSRTVTKTNRSGNPYESTVASVDTLGKDFYLLLDTSEKQILTLNYQGKEKIISPTRKIGIGWLLLSTALAVYPAFIDAYTGAWYYFEKVDVTF